jgi:hypothetical protein
LELRFDIASDILYFFYPVLVHEDACEASRSKQIPVGLRVLKVVEEMAHRLLLADPGNEVARMILTLQLIVNQPVLVLSVVLDTQSSHLSPHDCVSCAREWQILVSCAVQLVVGVLHVIGRREVTEEAFWVFFLNQLECDGVKYNLCQILKLMGNAHLNIFVVDMNL